MHREVSHRRRRVRAVVFGLAIVVGLGFVLAAGRSVELVLHVVHVEGRVEVLGHEPRRRRAPGDEELQLAPALHSPGEALDQVVLGQAQLLLDQATLTTQAFLASEQADLQNLALLENARRDLQRYQALFKQDSIAKQQVDTWANGRGF